MQTYLAIIEKIMIENGLCSLVIFAAAGIVIISILLCLLMRAGYRAKLVNLDSELKKECVNHEQDRVQLSDSLNTAHEKIQQQEAELTAQASRVEQLENDQQAAQAVAERAAALEGQRNQYLLELLDTCEKECGLDVEASAASDAGSEDALWKRHGEVIAALTNRLHAEEWRCSELEKIQQSGLAMLAEKETALEALTNTANEQAAHIADIERDFAERLDNAGAALSKLQIKYRTYRTYIGRLAWGRMQVFNDLNTAAYKIHQLEADLKTKENQYEEQRVIDEVMSDDATHVVLSEEQPVIVEPQRLDQDYIKQLAEKDAVIDELATELDARQRHISRLEDMLDAKTQNRSAAVPAEMAQVSEQEQVVEESEQLLATKPTAISKAVEKAVHFPQELKDQWLGLFKKQAHDVSGNEQPSADQAIGQINPAQASTDDEGMLKTGYIPEQLKGLYQKMASFTR